MYFSYIVAGFRCILSLVECFIKYFFNLKNVNVSVDDCLFGMCPATCLMSSGILLRPPRTLQRMQLNDTKTHGFYVSESVFKYTQTNVPKIKKDSQTLQILAHFDAIPFHLTLRKYSISKKLHCGKVTSLCSKKIMIII